MRDLLNSLNLFHALVNDTLDRIPSDSFSGVRKNLESLCLHLTKVRSLAKNNRKRRIAVFGPPKRGKSTVLNVFLGADILPSGTMPKTHCVVEINNIAGTNESPVVKTYDPDGYCQFNHCDTNQEFKDAIENCFKKDSCVERIEVFGDFSSGIMPGNSVLIDTPGAEEAFESDAHADKMGDDRGEELANDTRRALSVLNDVDIPLFCMRGDQAGSETERRFYQKYMQKIRPINIINFKDKCDDEDDANDVFNNCVNEYGLIRRETVFVSARLGAKCSFNGEKLSDESGFPRLNELVTNRLNSMMPLECLKISTQEYESIVMAVQKENCGFELPRASLMSYMASLNNFDDGANIQHKMRSNIWS